ncbi:serine hydrolase [Luteimonas sp. SJ-92]|uniref:Serine hydrolase n=1 Tax=Luteimonas salinisoli TaxID=2752307 RepID=A0A853J7W3_9GAMM|nr:serine hydrolase [Luteimonas salinisoli]NZA24789.1 serine hydrolase [Luteimonas salinisoli]
MANSLRLSRIATLLASLLAATAASAAPPGGFDARVQEAMQAHGVPGMAIAIVEDGEVALARGYGLRRVGAPEPVDADTIFPTGSTGKAVTAVALAILVDEGRLGWDDKVIDHLPDFRMHDAWVTREMTVRDLLVHRSGLGLGAGDLLYVPRTSRSRADVVRALRHIAPATSFRSGYAYDNILYVVAGELVAAVGGMSWEDFIRRRVFEAAGMTSSVSLEDDRFANPNRAHPHARIGGRVRGLGEQQVLPEREGLGQIAAPAGGLSSSANDLARWLQIQLGQGALPGGGDARLYSEASAQEMWTPQVLVPVRRFPPPIDGITPQFSTYALGWSVQDYRGARLVQHGGAVFGVLTMVVLMPDREVGFALQMNSEDVQVLRGLMYELLDHYLDGPADGWPQKDWVAAFDEWNRARLEAGVAALDAAGGKDERARGRPSLAPSGYAGAYADPWYGPIAIRADGGRLRIDFSQSPGMVGTLTHHRHDTFRADWDDRAIEPAYATFALDAEGEVERITMKAVSPVADFSYDYHDLLFTPVEAAGPNSR